MDIGGPSDHVVAHQESNSKKEEEVSPTGPTAVDPPPCNHNSTTDLTIMEEEDFLTKVRQSIDNQEPLKFSGFQVTLTKGAIRLKRRDKLEIHGGLIQGAIHSLFQIDGDKKQNPRRLTLCKVTLVHTKEDEDPRQIGAAIFAMGSCLVTLTECDISSKGGFAVWAKHRCTIIVDQCTIHHVARTAVACFNSVNVTISNTSIHQAGIHGVCGRGTSVMTIRNTTLDHCQVRAVMVYQGGRISMEDCVITNTNDPTTPTIHAQGPPELVEEEEQPEKNKNEADDKQKDAVNGQPLIPLLRLKGCKVSGNTGPPLVLEGKVHKDLVDNQILP